MWTIHEILMFEWCMQNTKSRWVCGWLRSWRLSLCQPIGAWIAYLPSSTDQQLLSAVMQWRFDVFTMVGKLDPIRFFNYLRPDFRILMSKKYPAGDQFSIYCSWKLPPWRVDVHLDNYLMGETPMELQRRGPTVSRLCISILGHLRANIMSRFLYNNALTCTRWLGYPVKPVRRPLPGRWGALSKEIQENALPWTNAWVLPFDVS